MFLREKLCWICHIFHILHTLPYFCWSKKRTQKCKASLIRIDSTCVQKVLRKHDPIERCITNRNVNSIMLILRKPQFQWDKKVNFYWSRMCHFMCMWTRKRLWNCMSAKVKSSHDDSMRTRVTIYCMRASRVNRIWLFFWQTSHFCQFWSFEWIHFLINYGIV